MNQEELEKAAKEIISQEVQINTDSINLDTELISLDIDSLDILKLAAALEKSFDITITTSELILIRTFGNVVDGLESKIAARRQSISMNPSEPDEK